MEFNVCENDQIWYFPNMSIVNHWHQHYQLLKNYLDSNFKFLFQTTLTQQTFTCSK